MARTGISNLVRIAGRGLQTTRIPRTLLPSIAAAPVISQMVSIVPASAATARFVSQSSGRQNIKTPDNKPVEPKTVEMPEVIQTAADITDNEYHAIADEFMERMLHHFEELQETKADMDVEFSVRYHDPVHDCEPC